MTKSRVVLRIILALHVAIGGACVVALALASPMALGRGQFDSFVHGLETFDFKWWFTGAALVIWLLPILLVLLWRRASEAGLEAARLRTLVDTMLKDRYLPVTVDVDARIPVTLDGPLRTPVALQAEIDIDTFVDLEAEVPVKTEIPVDTEIETHVPLVGSLRIPVRGLVPVEMVVPMQGRVHVKARVPVNLREQATVEIPPLDVPVATRLRARIDLGETLKAAKGLLKRP